MTEEEKMQELAKQLNSGLNKLIPRGMRCVVLLYSPEGHLMTLGNVCPADIHLITKLGLEIIERQLAVMTSQPANDTPPPQPPSTDPVRCRFCRRIVEGTKDTCASCLRMSSPQRLEGYLEGKE